MFRFEALDTGGSEVVSDAVRRFDEEFGPISHLYVVCGIPMHLRGHPDAWKLVSFIFLFDGFGGSIICVLYRILRLRW
jgi:hypothetical protein